MEIGGNMHRIDLDQLEFVHPKLREIMREIDRKFGEQIITSMYRIGDPGVMESNRFMSSYS